MPVRTARPRAGRVVALAILLLALAAVPASAQVTTDINNWALGPSTTTYGNGTQFHISQSGGGPVDYRWLDSDMTKTTVISVNACVDYALYGKSTFDGGDTSYHRLLNAGPGLCFVFRGRTNAGTTIPHDGRLRR